MNSVIVPRILKQLNWKWTTAGVEITLRMGDGRPCVVLVPLRDVEVAFSESLAEVGCPMLPNVGAPGTTEGFLCTLGAMAEVADDDDGDGDDGDDEDFEDLPMGVGGRRRRRRKSKRRARRAKRKNWRRTASKSQKKARRRRRRKKFFGGIVKGIKKVGKIAKKVVTNPVFRAGFAALSTVVPVLAPAAAGLEVASRVVKKIDKGVAAAKKLARKGRRGLSGTDSVASLQRAIREADEAKAGIEQMKQLALEGNKDAQRALGAIVSAQAIMSE